MYHANGLSPSLLSVIAGTADNMMKKMMQLKKYSQLRDLIEMLQ